jgi:hypothetical protein
MRNVLKRRAGGNLLHLLRNWNRLDWPVLARTMFDQTKADGGVFHLWGHSWELTALGLWKPLEEMLRFLHEHSDASQRLTNAGVCDVLAASEPAS